MVELTASVAIESLLRATDDDATPIIRRLARNQARAFLATQPATSQEGEGKLHRKLRTIYDVLHDIHDRCEDEGDRIYLGSTEDRHTLKRQLRYLEKLIPDALLYPTLAATPTPSTLSEDLREIPDEVFRKIADAKDVGTCRARVASLITALAQVKAS